MNRRGLVTSALRGIAFPAGALLLAAGVVLALTAAGAALEYRDAVALRGVVTGKTLVRADREKNRSTRFVARYRIDLPGGETVETEEDLPRAKWEALGVGDEHPVRYLVAQRKALPPPGSDAWVGNVIMGAIGLPLALVGGLTLRRPLRTVLDRMRLLERGTAATATVSDVFQTSTAVNRVILWQLRYRYRDSAGIEHESASDLMMPDEAAEWQPGASGPILYDPRRPATSAWLGRHAEPEEGPALGVRIVLKVRWLLGWVLRLALFFAALFVAGVIGELVPGLKELEAWMTTEQTPLLVATVGATIAGIFMLVGAVIVMVMEGGEPMSHTDIENQQRSIRDAAAGPRAWRASTYRLFGHGAGASGHDEFSFVELKRAAASGAVLRDPVWRRRVAAACGGMLIFLGLFGSFIVITPLALKLLLAAAVLYALARIAWGLARA